MAEILEGEGVGIALDDFSPESLRVGVERLLELVTAPDIPQRCAGGCREVFFAGRGCGEVSKHLCPA